MTTADTRPLDVAPMRGYRAGRRRRSSSVPRELLTIVTIWAITAYPILWAMAHVVGPWLHEVTTK